MMLFWSTFIFQEVTLGGVGESKIRVNPKIVRWCLQRVRDAWRTFKWKEATIWLIRKPDFLPLLHLMPLPTKLIMAK